MIQINSHADFAEIGENRLVHKPREITVSNKKGYDQHRDDQNTAEIPLRRANERHYVNQVGDAQNFYDAAQ